MARRQARTPLPVAQPEAALQRAIGSTEMDTHLQSGRAAPLSQVVPFIARYQDTWWLSTQAGWLPIAPPIAAVLDKHAQRMRQQDAMIAANRATIRALIDLTHDPASSQEQPSATKDLPGDASTSRQPP